jgi:polar amino acid transport system substrate-binding protein
MQVGFSLLVFVLGGAGAIHAAELSEIQDRGYLIVGVKDNLRPLGFTDEQPDGQHQLQGFEIDLARQLAADLLGDAQAVEFKPLLNQDRLNALLEGEVDVLIARMTITDARTRLIAFSRPYYVDGTAFLAKDRRFKACVICDSKPLPF